MDQSVRFGRGVEITLSTEIIDITCGIPTASETWRYTDTNGHEHHYERGYPTLNFIIDEQHWCNGDEGYEPHDPHWAIDAAHYECKLCKVTVVPGVDPAFTPKSMSGLTTGTIKGRRRDGTEIVGVLTSADLDRLRAEPTEETAAAILNEIPSDRITSLTFASR